MCLRAVDRLDGRLPSQGQALQLLPRLHVDHDDEDDEEDDDDDDGSMMMNQ